MSKFYEEFKRETIEAGEVATKVSGMRFISDDFARGFLAGMHEAREIFMRVEDELKLSPEKDLESTDD